MNTIIFDVNNYSNLPTEIKKLYVSIGGLAYALIPRYLKIDKYNLPKWLSVDQYKYFKNLIGNYYTLTTVGFNNGAIPVMKLDDRLARGIRYSYISSKIPANAKISKLEYLKLSPEDKLKYTEITLGNTIYYVNNSIRLNKKAMLTNNSIRQPVVGINNVPVGRWVEMN